MLDPISAKQGFEKEPGARNRLSEQLNVIRAAVESCTGCVLHKSSQWVSWGWDPALFPSLIEPGPAAMAQHSHHKQPP